MGTSFIIRGKGLMQKTMEISRSRILGHIIRPRRLDGDG